MTAPSRLAIISGCSGYGGLDEAVVAATGGQVVAHIEYDDAPARILEHRYPGVPNYRDVTKVDWLSMADEVVPEGWELCLTAGYPCQPFSSAGKRRGVEDERHLWPHFAEAIRQLRPALVVFENVRNHLNLGFDVVLADLAELGYDTTWTLLRASDVGAPHGRARLFIVGRRRNHPTPTRMPVARLDVDRWVEPFEGLFGSVDWAGRIPVTGRVVDGAMFELVLPELTEAAQHAADPAEDRLLPTPDASVFNDGQEVEVWQARKERERAKGYNGNGGGTPLAMAVRLLPTPEAKLSDSGPDYARADREGSGGDDLTTTVFRAFVTDDPARQLLPTPVAGDTWGAQGPEDPAEWEAWKAERAARGIPTGQGMLSTAVGQLLPTPAAADSDRTTAAYGRGNPTLGGALLLPSPTAALAGGGQTSRSGDRKDELLLSGIAEAATEGKLLPTPEASDGTGGRITAERGGQRPSGSKRAVYLATAIAHDVVAPTAERLLPTPTCQDGANTGGPSQFERNSLPLNALATTLAPKPEPVASRIDWGPYAAAVARWEAVVGPAPAPTEPNTAGKQRLSPQFPEWMMGLPRGWVTEVPGLSRNEQLKALGNGVVPQQGYVAVARQLAALPW